MPIIRLDRFFSTQEILSRKDTKVFVKTGRIRVNDAPATACDQHINTDVDSIYLDMKLVEYKPLVYIMLNKPQGVVSSTNDKLNKTVIELVPKELFRASLFPAGRLDKDTVGFVFITNDGDMAHNILSPKNHVKKYYHVCLDTEISDMDIKKIEGGIVLADQTVCQTATVNRIGQACQNEFEVIICEGKYHQIKRMFGAVGCGVTALKRVKIGNLPLDEKLQEGECREILHKELDLLQDKSV